jgi:signal transduction histidine kinase/CheY-like chemotaxis protein
MKDSFAIYDDEGKLAAFNKSFANWFSKGGAMQDLARMETFLAGRAVPLAHGEQTRENEIQFDDKSWLRIESSQTPVGETVLYGADITQSRLREEALVERTRQVEAQAQRMEELAAIAERAAKVKSSFLAAMSHEIRTPLNAINGFTQLLRKNHVDDESNRITALISDSCRHLLDIVDDILDFTRLEADKVTLHLTPITVRNLVSELIQTAQVLTKDKPVKVAFDVAPAIPERINADQRRLKQILLNLISNAAKFTQQGSIEVHVKLNGDRILFEVSDTGDGIPPAVGARIFEPFEQASPEGQLRAAGTGLGLAITRRLVNLMGGHISFRNHEGGGTIFCVDLPFSPAVDREIKSTPSPEALRDIGNLNILIADDAPSSRMLLRLMLSKHGHKVDEAENGLQAVESLTAKSYDLVVLDVQMPVMDGLRAAQTVRAMPNEKAQLPLIALTAQVLDEEVERAKQAGFDIVLGKPFMEEDLRNAIREALNERKSV